MLCFQKNNFENGPEFDTVAEKEMGSGITSHVVYVRVFWICKNNCIIVLSISYMMVDFIANHCSPKNGTFGTLEMLLTQEVDVIFGPVCSTGRL